MDYVTGTLRQIDALSDEEWLQRIGPQIRSQFVSSLLYHYHRTGYLTARQRAVLQKIRREWSAQLEVALRRTAAR